MDLERQLEAEQECIVNKLHKQNAGLERERRTLRAECETLRKQVDELSTEKARLGREKVRKIMVGFWSTSRAQPPK